MRIGVPCLEEPTEILRRGLHKGMTISLSPITPPRSSPTHSTVPRLAPKHRAPTCLAISFPTTHSLTHSFPPSLASKVIPVVVVVVVILHRQI